MPSYILCIIYLLLFSSALGYYSDRMSYNLRYVSCTFQPVSLVTNSCTALLCTLLNYCLMCAHLQVTEVSMLGRSNQNRLASHNCLTRIVSCNAYIIICYLVLAVKYCIHRYIMCTFCECDEYVVAGF